MTVRACTPGRSAVLQEEAKARPRRTEQAKAEREEDGKVEAAAGNSAGVRAPGIPPLPSPPLLPSSQGAHLGFFLNQGWAPAMDETQIPPGHRPSSEVYLGMYILTFSPSCPGGPGSPISPCSQNNLRSLSEQRRIVALPLCWESLEGMYLHCLHFAGEDSDEDSELCAPGP